MARVKRTLPRNPNADDAQQVRRSGRNRTNAQTHASDRSSEVVEHEDNLSQPLRRTTVAKPSSTKSEKGESSDPKKLSDQPALPSVLAETEEPPSNDLALVLYTGPQSAITEQVPFSDNAKNLPVLDHNREGCAESTKVDEIFIRPPEFSWFFDSQNSTSNVQKSSSKDTEVDEHIEMETLNTTQEGPKSPPSFLPNLNESIWTDEDEPLIERIEPRKRKYLGKAHAKKTTVTEPLRKRLRSMTVVEEASETDPLETDFRAAASSQHEKSVRKQVEEGRLAKFVKRPNRPHRGFSSSAAAKLWPKFQTRIGLPDKGFDEQSIREFHFIKQVVETQGLEKLCEIYRSYNLTLIREFYCEVATNSSSRLTIRGIPVHLTTKKINAFLSLTPLAKPNIRNC